MANSNDIQALMSTKISVDSAQANDNVTRLTNGFKELTSSWKAEQAVAKANGDVVKAAEVRYKGLSDTLDVQKLKLEQLQTRRRALKSEMESSAVVTKDQTDEMKVLDRQLGSTARSVASLSKQQERAKHSFEYVSSGLKELRNEYYTNNRAIDANVAKLEAQGHSAEAQKAKLAGLRESLQNLSKQESAAQKLAEKAADSEGKQSNIYLRRKTDLDKVSRSIAETKNQIKSMESTMQSNTGWSKFHRDLFGVSRAEKQVVDNGHRIRDIFTGAFLSNLATSALTTLQTHLTGIIKTGYKVALAGREIQARWSNLGVSNNGVQRLTKEMADLKANSNMSADSVTALQMRFYDLTGHSIPQTMKLTKGVAALTDTLHLSSDQTESFSRTLTRVESAGKVTQQSLGRIERAAPGFSTALQRASGMSRKSFDQLVQSGKMTSSQFNDILAKASKDYGKNAKYFNNTYDGAMHHLSETWKSTQRTIARPLMNVATAGLQSLDKVLSNKNIQNALNGVAQAVAHVADGAAKVLTKQNITGMAEVAISLTKIAEIMLKTVWNTFSGIILGIAKAFHLAGKGSKTAKSGIKVFGDAMEGIAKHQKAIEGITKALIALFAIKKTVKLINDLNAFRRSVIAAARHVKVLGKDLLSLPKDTKTRVVAMTQRAKARIQKLGSSIKKVTKFVRVKIGAATTAARNGVHKVGAAVKRLPKKVKVVATAATRSAQANIRKVGSAAKSAARTTKNAFVETGQVIGSVTRSFASKSKIAFLQIGQSARTLGTTLKMAFMSNPFGVIMTAISALITAFQWLYDNDKPFRKWVDGIKKGLVKTLNGAFGKAVKFITGFGKSVARIFNSLGKTFDRFQKNVKKRHIQSEKEWIKHNRSLQKSLSRAGKNMAKQASRDGKTIWQQMTRWGGQGSKKISRQFDWLSRQTQKQTRTMFRKHRQVFQVGYKVLQDRTRTWHDVMTGHWDRLSSDTQRTSRDMSRYHHAIFRDMYNRLNDLTNGCLGDMVKSWQSKMGNIGDTVANAKKAIHDHFVDLVRGIIQPFNDMLEDLHKGINWVLEKVGASKIGGTWSVPMPSYAVGTPGTHPGGLAKVNDAPTSHYRELYRLPNGKMGMFPAVRNMILPLPAGTSVLDGERSYQLSRMMGIIPHYADGTLDAVGNFFGDLKDDAENFLDNTEKFLKHPIEFMESIFKKFVKVSTPVQFATDLVQHVPVYIAKQMANWVKKQLEVFSNPGGAGVERWRPYIIRAFHQLGLEPVAWKVNKLLKQIQTESNGNPLAFQHGYTDANSGGNEARGLLQFALSTWNADALPGHKDWRNGYNEILAAISVLERGGEGGWGNVGMGHGWANGGLVTTHGLYEMAERNKPEFIIPTDITRRDRAYQLLGQLMTRFKADDPRISTLGSDTDNLKNVEKKMDTMIGLLSELLGSGNATVQAIKNQGSLDVKRLYKRQALDASMRAFS